MKIKNLGLIACLCLFSCSGEESTSSTNNNTTQNQNNTNKKTTKSSNNTRRTNNNATTSHTTKGTTSQTCSDQTIYTEDFDGDGVAAIDSASEVKCLKKSELSQYALTHTDCNDKDPTQYPGSEGVCGDHVVDTCDGDPPQMIKGALCQVQDESCPETQAGTIDEPQWNCEGAAPQNVYAYATFDDGNKYFKDGACFIFFEGFKNGFYVKHNLDQKSTDASCDSAKGCVCPSANGFPSYDRRLYAFTSDDKEQNCPEIKLKDHGCSEDLVQPVSNQCRKYLDLLHPYESNSSPKPFDHPYSYVAGSQKALDLRLRYFKTLEVACVKDSVPGLNWATLMTGTIKKNDAFVKK